MKRNPYLSILHTALAALLIAAAASCSDDAPNDVPTPGTDATNLVTVRFGSGDDDDKPETRTTIHDKGPEGIDVLWATTDEISISAVRTDVTGGTNETNKKYNPTTEATSSPFIPADGGDEMQLAEGTYTFYSYYPWESGNAADKVNYFELPEMTQTDGTSSNHIGKYDLMWDRQEDVTISAEGTPKVSFQYKHVFPMLVFKIENANGKEVKTISVRSADGTTPVRGYVDVSLADGKIEQVNNSYYYTSLTFTTPMDATGTGRLLILPQAAGAELTVSLMTTDNTIYEYTRTAADGLQGGNSYSFTFNLDAGTITERSVYTPNIVDKVWQIGDENAFRGFALAVNYYGYTSEKAVLTKDINLSSYDNWEPIGRKNTKYSGNFDGQGYTVSGLTINRTSGDYVGLFGYLSGATVQNLRVKGNITAENSYDVGGIAGEIKDNSVIKNCLFDGDVQGYSYVGGIAGYNGTSIITDCFSSGNVIATSQFAGGIAGYNTNFEGNALLSNCYSKASVIAKEYVGGIIGSNNNSTTVSSCYATGDVSAENSAGGIAGDNYNAFLKNCLALGSTVTRTSGEGTNFGRVVGEKHGDNANISGCGAWEGMTLPSGVTATSDPGSIHGKDLDRATCKEKNTYTTRGFDTSVWAFDEQTTWEYLPWIKAFENFHGINEADYRIAIPDHLEPVVP